MIPGFACFFGCLFYELEMGIGFGVLIQILMILYHTARPHLEDEIRKVPGPGDQDKMYLSITPHAGVLFPAVTHVRAVITNKSINQDFPRYMTQLKILKMSIKGIILYSLLTNYI